MKSKTNPPREIPSLEQLTAELERENYKRRYNRVLRSTIYTLIVVAAVALSATGSKSIPRVEIMLNFLAIFPSIMSVRQESASTSPAATYWDVLSAVKYK